MYKNRTLADEFQEQYDIRVLHKDGLYNPIDENDITSLMHTFEKISELHDYANAHHKESAFREICDAAALCYGQSATALPAEALGNPPEQYPGMVCKTGGDFVSRVSDDLQHGSVNVYLDILQSVPEGLNMSKSFDDLHVGDVVYCMPDNIATDDMPKICNIGTVYGSGSSKDSSGKAEVEKIEGQAFYKQTDIRSHGRTDKSKVSFSKQDFGKTVFTSINMCRAALAYEKEVFHQGLKAWEKESGMSDPSDESIKQMESEYNADMAQKGFNGFGVDVSKPIGELSASTRVPVKMTEEQKAQTQQALNSKWSRKRELPTIDGDALDAPDMTFE